MPGPQISFRDFSAPILNQDGEIECFGDELGHQYCHCGDLTGFHVRYETWCREFCPAHVPDRAKTLTPIISVFTVKSLWKLARAQAAAPKTRGGE